MSSTTAHSTTRRRKDPEDRRQEIIAAAAGLGIREGLSHVTARRVASALDIRSGLVNHYFPTIDELIAAAFTQLVNEERNTQQSLFLAESTATGRVRVLVEAATAPTRDPMSLLWLDAWRQSADRLLLRDAVIAEMERDIATLGALIEEGVRSGEFIVESPATAAIRILALLDGQGAAAAVRAALSGSTLDYPAVEQMVVEVAERELGLAPGSLS